MNILISNDDGFGAAGIEVLAKELEKSHKVVVVAPNQNRSGASHSITLEKGVSFEKKEENRYVCSGTPADCVFYALLGAIDFKPDLVLGGINQGPNLGTDVIYSGTVAIARQAALSSIPAMALSYCSYVIADQFLSCANEFAKKLEWLFTLIKQGQFLNINFPQQIRSNATWKEATLSNRHYQDFITLNHDEGNRYHCSLSGKPVNLSTESPNCDWVLTNEGAITYTILEPII